MSHRYRYSCFKDGSAFGNLEEIEEGPELSSRPLGIKHLLVNINIWELNNNGTVRMIKEFIQQCPVCQVMNRMRLQIKTHRFTCASYNPFEVLNIGPLTKDPTGWMNVYHGIIHFW